MQRLATFALILFCLASASATPKQDNLAKQFVGAWRLISVEGQPAGAPGFYEHATGMIIYDPSGWVSVQIANKGDRKPFVKGVASGTPAEKAAAFDSYLAYYLNPS